MLGLASTVSSGSPVESLYSLNFDGSDDYLDLKSLAAGLSLADNAAYSISLWFNTTDASGSAGVNILVGVNGTNNDNVLRLGAGLSGGGIFFNGTADGTKNTTINAGTNYSDGAWHHLMLSRPAGSGENTTFYVDGSSIGTSNHDILWSDTTLFFLGAEADAGSLGDYFQGKIDEFSIWSSALDSSAATSIYNRGSQHDLTSGAAIGTGPLVAYYRMGNGFFDDKANGAIHDQHAPGFGSNLIVWDGSTTGDWNETQSGNTTLSANSGNLRAAADASGAYGTSRSCTTVVGAVYRVDATINVDNASGGAGNFRVSNNENLSSQIATLSTSTGAFTSYFTATATTTHVGVTDTAADGTNYMEIEKISVRKLNGLPGLTSGGATFSSDVP